MPEKSIHHGASSEEATYLRIARCIYSGNEKMYDTASKYWNEDKQNNLNARFMKYDCQCKRCKERREDRQELIAALERDNDTDGLRALGVI